MTFFKASSFLATFVAVSHLFLAPAFADDAKPEMTPECASAQKDLDVLWDKVTKCLEDAAEEEFEGISVDASKCDPVKKQAMAKEGSITEPFSACPNVTKGTFRNSFFIGPKLGTEIGYTTAGTGGFIMRFKASPIAGLFDSRDHSPQNGMSMEFGTIEVGIRYTDNIFTLDSLSVKFGEFEKYFIEHLGINLSSNLIWDTNRGQVLSNWDGKIILNLLKTAFTSLYRGQHIVVGAGARFQLRDFTVIAGPEQIANFEVPVSLDMAFTFLEGRLTFAAFAEAAFNPLRLRDYSVKGRVEVRGQLYRDIKEMTPSATNENYHIDVGAKYEIDYQNETAFDYGKPRKDPMFLGDQLVHRALAFFEIAF